MSLENTKIVDRLLMLRKKANMEIDKALVEASKKYEMDLTKAVLHYSGSVIKETIDKIIQEEAEKFKFIKIIIDYIICESQLDIILNIAKFIRDNLERELPEESKISDLSITLDENMKLIIIEFPAEWGIPIVDEYRENLLEMLRQNDIVKI